MIPLEIALAGLTGTITMVCVMSLIHDLKWANADMVRAIGSIYTRSLDNAFWPGILTHCAAGVAFAFLYALFIGYAPQIGPSGACLLGALLGLAHGLWVGLLLVVEVAEDHPLPEFREAGIGVAVAHCIGHLFYGFTVGLVFAMNWIPTKTAIMSFNPGAALADFVGYAAVWLPLFGVPLAFFAYLTYLGYMAWHKEHGTGRH